MPSLDDFLALDMLTLRDHTLHAGDSFDTAQQRAQLVKTLAEAEVCTVARAGNLLAYAMLRPETDGCWFVTGFNTHPAHRNAAVMQELIAGIVALAREHGIAALRSHVYKTNALSLAFHRRLGFAVTRENDKAVEFTATLADLAQRPAVRRAMAQAAT
ncbi:MAG: GNAT family N-acetyltransferase [Burkholderiales bacterium]|nr:GNAT family N-acetyltransferase [Burkholderiales bacterium]